MFVFVLVYVRMVDCGIESCFEEPPNSQVAAGIAGSFPQNNNDKIASRAHMAECVWMKMFTRALMNSRALVLSIALTHVLCLDSSQTHSHLFPPVFFFLLVRLSIFANLV